MNLDWILSPLTVYAAVSAGLVATIVLFAAAKADVRRALFEARASRESADSAIQELIAKLEQLRAEANPSIPTPVPGAGPALNLTKRTQALRMLRRGEPVESIASALRTPRHEIELLVKLQGMHIVSTD